MGGRSGQGRQEAAQEEVGLCTPHPTKKRTRLGWPKPICISSFRPKLTSASFPLYQHPPPPSFFELGRRVEGGNGGAAGAREGPEGALPHEFSRPLRDRL